MTALDAIMEIERLEAEIERLRTGLGMVSQILSGGGRASSMIAQATLDGADLLDEETAIQVCSGLWRKPKPTPAAEQHQLPTG